MTPTRAKRSSKVPSRFSSDNSRIETSNANGETIIDYNDKSTSTTHTLAPISRVIKLKPAIREPLKVKLPKLKRPHSQSTKEHNTVKSNTPIIKIHKIKLPSLSSKKSKNDSKKSHSKGHTNSVGAIAEPKVHNLQEPNAVFSSASIAPSSKIHSPSNIANVVPGYKVNNHKQPPTTSKLDDLNTSKSPDGGEESSLANSSLSSDNADEVGSRMQIIVSPSEPSSGSGIRCPCGVDDDLGVMVECEKCSTWQHGHCINVGTEEDAYEGYICAFCALPPGQYRHSLCQLTVGDKFQSRFKLLEALRRQMNDISNSEKKSNFINTIENNAQFTVDELSQAIMDLQRVLGSLKVKWKLLNTMGDSYGQDLRIWQHPYWSETPRPELDKNIYFLDRWKSNLELNIRNMVSKAEERCRLIDYAISLIQAKRNNFGNIDISKDDSLNKIQCSLEEVSNGVREFKNKLKTRPGY